MPIISFVIYLHRNLKILNVMSTKNCSNLVSEIDLDKCMDYFVTKLVYDDGSIKYRIVHLENGFNHLGKELLFDDIHAVLDYIAYN